MGRPPAVHTDASLGFSVMGFQFKEIGFDHADGEQQVLLLLEGKRCKGHRAPKASPLTPWSKTGYCSRCTVSTPVAVRTLYKRGMYSDDKAIGVKMSQHFRPWAGRSCAATLYLQPNDTLPDEWDWAAENLYMSEAAVRRAKQE